MYPAELELSVRVSMSLWPPSLCPAGREFRRAPRLGFELPRPDFGLGLSRRAAYELSGSPGAVLLFLYSSVNLDKSRAFYVIKHFPYKEHRVVEVTSRHVQDGG